MGNPDLDEYTVVELLDAARLRMIPYHSEEMKDKLGYIQIYKEIKIAENKVVEAQMWFTRGLARRQGILNPADLEKLDV